MLVSTLREVLHEVRGYVVSLAQSLERLCVLWDVVALRRDAVSRHGWIVLCDLLPAFLLLVLGLLILVLVLILDLSLLALWIRCAVCLTAFSFRAPALRILEEVQFRRELAFRRTFRCGSPGLLARLALQEL